MSFAKLGYEAKHYEMVNELTVKELYYKYAEGRDEGLSKMDVDSPEAFTLCFNERHRCGGHLWEVCRGGNSTHMALYVAHNDEGYYIYLTGKV